MQQFPYRLLETPKGPFVVLANDIFFRSVISMYGEFCGNEADLLTQLCQPGDTVLDIGAHIGGLTIPLAHKVGATGRVIAFEPQKRVFGALTANLALHGIENVHAHNAGAGARPGSLQVEEEASGLFRNVGGSRLGATGKETVDIVTVDSLDLPPCQLAKIDVEGMELEVLHGSPRTIGPDAIVYFENSFFDGHLSLARSHALISHFMERDYSLFWHAPRFVVRRSLPTSGIDLFANGGSQNVLAMPKARLADPRWAAVNKEQLIPIESPDALLFPEWVDPQLIGRSLYDHARALGAAPRRAGDDENRPWIALYEAFLDWLARFAAAAELPPPPSPGTQRGWAFAHIWFHLTQCDPARTQILTAGMPRVFTAALRRVFETIDLEEISGRPFAGGNGSKDLIFLLGSEHQISIKAIGRSIFARGRRRAETIQLIEGARRGSTEGTLAPAIWRAGPDAAVMITSERQRYDP